MKAKRMQGNGFGFGIGNTNWDFKEDDDICDSTSIGSMSQDSVNSVISCGSSELIESEEAEADSSTSSSHSNGPYELSQLMIHLPVKRGLSMFYEGKSQSFTSLARIQNIEDLPKKETPYRKKMKTCKSYGGDLDSHKALHTLKATISKKSSRGSSSSVSKLSKRGTFLGSSRPSPIAVQNKF
ncbi:uncharacterized protein G2W53_034865 [Senna tora]|uniref:Oxidative stress 3 n=1 Tax=Senna tora TaxID=362788 RepID=A0A834WE53_9FABA|nr:uncharacterized protein G2W53_034865 [Senna tora]